MRRSLIALALGLAALASPAHADPQPAPVTLAWVDPADGCECVYVRTPAGDVITILLEEGDWDDAPAS
jgi:hypothetical protein